MALAFGGGVRPELGRTDYGAVARGSEIAAQLSAQGSQMMGQGLAKALEGAGAAVRGYQERKQEKQFTEQTLTNLGQFFKDNPDAVSRLGFNIDVNDKGALKAAVQGFGGGNFKAGAAIVTPLIAQYMQQEEMSKNMANAFAPEITTGPSAFEQAAMSGVGFGNLPNNATSNLQTINARRRTPEEITQRLLASGMAPGAAAAMFGTLTSAENARRPPGPIGISIGKYNETRNGQLVEVTVDQKTGREIAAVPVSPPPSLFESAYERDIGEQKAEEEKTIIERANKAVSQVAKLDEVLSNLEQGDPTTGLFAEIRNNVNRFRSQFMSDPEAAKSVKDTQLLNALLGSDVFPLIGELGIGARGIDTPQERNFLRDVFTGTIELNKDTLIKLTEMRRKRAAEAIEEYNESIDAGKFKRRERYFGEPMNKLSLPERTKPAPGVDLGGGFRLIP
jgi:hypothetical protein